MKPVMALLLGVALAVFGGHASAHRNVSFGVYVGSPAYVYTPAPVYYAAPPIYYPAPVYYYDYGPRYYDRAYRGWDRHPGHHKRHKHHKRHRH
jgi:hypothetical protein